MKFNSYFTAIVLFLSWITLSANAQKPEEYTIEINAPQWKNSLLYLGNHFSGNVYKTDSVLLSDKGTGILSGDKKLQEGMYLLFAPSISKKHVDLLIGDAQSFKMTIDTVDIPTKITISGSPDSEAFLHYTQYLSKKQKEQSDILAKMKDLPEEEQEPYKKQLEALNEEVSQFMTNFQQEHQGQWVGNFFKGLKQVEGPFPAPKSQEEYNQEITYLRGHFFDNIDLTDVRYWRTNYFPGKITAYMDHIVSKNPDSLAIAASHLVSQAKGDTLCFRLMLSFLHNYSVNSQIMGMENIWAKLYEDYYSKKQAAWADTAFVNSLEKEYKKLQYNRIGMKSPNMTFLDMNNHPVELYSIPSDYTLLYFFEPSCGHCKKTTPIIHDSLYVKFRDKGLEVLCVYTQLKKEEWSKFVEEHHLTDWLNVWDPQRQTSFWKYFDVSVTPGIYLLDKDKRIIAKKLDEETLERLLGDLTKN